MAREALSARLDGEHASPDDAALTDAAVDAHLADCADCRAWLEAAHTVTRRARLALVRPTPDLADAVVSAVLAERAARARGRRVLAARLGLVAAALAELAVCVPVLLLGHDREAPLHVAHEMGSFELALVVGCLAAAWRPRRAAGLVPFAGVAAACLVITAVLDVAGRQTTLSDEAPHLLVVASWLLLCALARSYADAPDGPSASRRDAGLPTAPDPAAGSGAASYFTAPLPPDPAVAETAQEIAC
jgi:predicted anti-sigma-YlaC factor YlaD